MTQDTGTGRHEKSDTEGAVGFGEGFWILVSGTQIYAGIQRTRHQGAASHYL